MTLIDKRTELV